MTDRSGRQLLTTLTYWERIPRRLPWAIALCAAIGLVQGLTAGRSGTAVITYALSSMLSQVFIGAPLLALLLAVFPSRRPVSGSKAPPHVG